MPYITVGNENSADIDIYYKDWGSGRRGFRKKAKGSESLKEVRHTK